MTQEVKNGKPRPRACKTLEKVSPEIVKDASAKKETPLLLDVLLPIWEGSVMLRQPGRLTIGPDGGSWRVTIECPTEGLQAVFMVDSLSTLLRDVETLLASGKTHWGLSWQKRKRHSPTIDDAIQ